MTVQTISDRAILANYAVSRLLGSGAYGEVFKALCKRTQKEMAIKRCFDAFRNSSGTLRIFISIHELDAQKMYRELSILLELRGNPLFAQLEDVIRAEGDKDLFCVFARMESDLHRGLSALSGTVIHRRYIMYQVVTAVSYLHSAKIVHRDLKPSNILVNWDNCHVRLCDFGLARSIIPGKEHIDSSSGALPIDNLTSYVATRWYRAPELILGSSLYDGSVDTWAVGCILGEMIRGKPMFPSSSTLEQLEKVLELTGLPSDLSHLKSESAKDLLIQLEGTRRQGKKVRDVADMLGFCSTNEEIDFVSKCLEFHPSKRATMAQLLNHPYFTPIRQIGFELVAPNYIRIPLDEEAKKRSTEEYKQAVFKIVAKLELERTCPLFAPTTADTEIAAQPDSAYRSVGEEQAQPIDYESYDEYEYQSEEIASPMDTAEIPKESPILVQESPKIVQESLQIEQEPPKIVEVPKIDVPNEVTAIFGLTRTVSLGRGGQSQSGRPKSRSTASRGSPLATTLLSGNILTAMTPSRDDSKPLTRTPMTRTPSRDTAKPLARTPMTRVPTRDAVKPLSRVPTRDAAKPLTRTPMTRVPTRDSTKPIAKVLIRDATKPLTITPNRVAPKVPTRTTSTVAAKTIRPTGIFQVPQIPQVASVSKIFQVAKPAPRVPATAPNPPIGARSIARKSSGSVCGSTSAVGLARATAAGLNRIAAAGARKIANSRASKEALFYQREVDELVASQIKKPSNNGIIPPLKFHLLEAYRVY